MYRLIVLVTDHNQDQDPTYHRSGSCTITIEIEVIEPQGRERIKQSLNLTLAF